MDRLILIRHGDYDPDTGSLDSDGIEQVNRLAAALATYIVRPVSIISSPATRTAETAALISELILNGTEVRYHNVLDIEQDTQTTDDDTKNAAIDNIFNNAGESAATIIMVTHDPIIDDYINHYLRECNGLKRRLHLAVRYAEAVMIDLGNGHVFVAGQSDSGVVIQRYGFAAS